MIHNGNINDLQTIIKGCGFTIDKVKEQEYGHQIRTNEGAIVDWYSSSTATIVIQGKKLAKDKLTKAWDLYTGVAPVNVAQSNDDAEAPLPHTPSNPASANKKVFLVHGHDSTAREQLELVLHKLGLDPFVLANTGGGGLTIIEALEAEIGTDNNQARFGIVLMTPDDMGYSNEDSANNAQPRARQNVVLEMGMLISAVGRKNVAILKKGFVEVPSDAQGILYIPFNEHVRETVPKLADRLREADFILKPESITRASS